MGRPKDCEGCIGYCCMSYDTVLLTLSDIRRISKYLDVEEQDFIDRYLVVANPLNKIFKIKWKTRPCIFWTGGICSIYKVRPAGCRKLQPMQSIGNITCRLWHKNKAGM